jgi:streptomycin 6-kinase
MSSPWTPSRGTGEPFVVPENLARSSTIDPAMAAWTPFVEQHVRDVAGRWSVELGAPFQPGGDTAWVAPVRTADGAEVVLKVGRWHEEAEHEADALRLWDGSGAVRLLRYERAGDTISFLLERCDPGTPLRERPEPEQDAVLADVLRRTWATGLDGTPFRPLRDLCRIWADETEVRAAERPDVVDVGLLDAALAVLRHRPPAEAGPDDVLLCTDLHAGNVLAARREPWLLVDPKPYVGERAYDVVQHLLNCPDRLVVDPVGLTARMAALCDLDVDSVRIWTFARCLTELWWWPHLLPAVEALAP